MGSFLVGKYAAQQFIGSVYAILSLNVAMSVFSPFTGTVKGAPIEESKGIWEGMEGDIYSPSGIANLGPLAVSPNH